MSTYYLFWVLLIGASLWVSLGAFLWAHRHGQFRDQERARFLPLRDESSFRGPKQEGASRYEAVVMCVILAMGFSAILAALVAALLKTAGVNA